MAKDSDRGRVQVSWLRRQWLKLVAVIQDHPLVTILMGGLMVAFVLFYGIRLNGFAHFKESVERFRLECFGGVHRVGRSVQTPDVVLSFHRFQSNRLDVTSMMAVHLNGTAFRKELREIAAEPGGLIRINALDPRISRPSHPQHARFVECAAAFGLQPWEYQARCLHSIAVLIHLKRELGDALEVRLVSVPAEEAEAPYFTIGRSGQAYRSDDPKKRLDVLVPRPAEPTGSDSFTHPGLIIVDRKDNEEVQRFTKVFEELWAVGTPLDEELQNEFLSIIRGKSTPGN